MSYPVPTFYDPAKTAELYIERSDLIATEAIRYKQQHNISPAVKDREKIAVFGVDTQIGFMFPGASLFVPGAVEDANRALQFIYGNIDKITALHFSLDTHKVFQIFHPAFWIDNQGNHPDPMTAITTADIRKGIWQAVMHPKKAYEYCEALEQAGKKVLIVWPYHTLLGGVSHALLPAVMEAAIFHTLLRKSQTHFEAKGTHMMTENYSVLEPDVKRIGNEVVGEFNAAFFEMLMTYDRIYIWGEASSHCVAETVFSLERSIQRQNPDLMDKIYLLEDAMSPVPKMGEGELDFPEVSRQALDHFRQIGMHIVRTTDPL